MSKGTYTGLILSRDRTCSSIFLSWLNFPTFLIPESEAQPTLGLIFTDKPNRIYNLPAGPPLADLRRGHVSLLFDFILDSTGYTMILQFEA